MNLLSFRHLWSSAEYYEKDPLETCILLNLRSCPSEKRGQERGSTQKLSIQQFVSWEEKDGMFVKWSPITKKTKPTSQALPALQVLSCGKIWMWKWRGEREPSCGVKTPSGRGLSEGVFSLSQKQGQQAVQCYGEGESWRKLPASSTLLKR